MKNPNTKQEVIATLWAQGVDCNLVMCGAYVTSDCLNRAITKLEARGINHFRVVDIQPDKGPCIIDFFDGETRRPCVVSIMDTPEKAKRKY